MNASFYNEVSMALTDSKPVENVASLAAVAMWEKTNDTLWLKAWIALNGSSYGTVKAFVDDMIEVFDL